MCILSEGVGISSTKHCYFNRYSGKTQFTIIYTFLFLLNQFGLKQSIHNFESSYREATLKIKMAELAWVVYLLWRGWLPSGNCQVTSSPRNQRGLRQGAPPRGRIGYHHRPGGRGDRGEGVSIGPASRCDEMGHFLAVLSF